MRIPEVGWCGGRGAERQQGLLVSWEQALPDEPAMRARRLGRPLAVLEGAVCDRPGPPHTPKRDRLPPTHVVARGGWCGVSLRAPLRRAVQAAQHCSRPARRLHAADRTPGTAAQGAARPGHAPAAQPRLSEPRRCRHAQDGLLSGWREDSLSRALASQLSAICNSLAPGKSVEVGDARGGRQLGWVCPDRPFPPCCRVL